MYLSLSHLPRRVKILIVLFSDVVLLPLALYSAIALRVGAINPHVENLWWVFLIIPVFTVPIFLALGLYRAVVRFMDDKIIITVLYGVTLSVFILTALIFLSQVRGIPRSSLIIYWVIAIAYITSSRFMARGILRTLEGKDRRQNVAIYGAGRSGLQTALALFSGPEYRPVVFFDDNKNLHGTDVLGIRVHDPQFALQIMADKGCRQLLIAMPSATRTCRKEIIQRCEGHDLVLKTLPGMGEIVGGLVRVEDIREVGVEDLLGRDPVPPFGDLISLCIRDKVVLVTGAGGSIGAELCRQIILNEPKKLILFEQSEYALYKIEQDLAKYKVALEIVPVLGDVTSLCLMENLILNHRVQTIYHAAAFKHVPLVESNVSTGVLNNVFGTFSASMAAIKGGVETFVLISTDKAVRPTNVMGASKRLAELVLQALSQDKSHNTRFCMVRFGNVLGSSGSVVPLFKEQIRSGGPITVTHPDVTRFFMTIPEAAQLVLQAGSLGVGGDVFVLDMGESVKIVDLAKKMIELSGLEFRGARGDGDISIQFTGLRPGEKLYEELLIGDRVSWTKHPRIMTAQEDSVELKVLLNSLEVLQKLCASNEDENVREMLMKLVPEYKPN